MKNNSLRLSASQIDTADTCLVKWWLNKVAKCPQPFDRKLLVGEVGHGVCENHLQKLPLYPVDWTSPLNRFTGRRAEQHITTTEQALIKTLIRKSIDEGVLVRHPDTEVEREFRFKAGEVEGVKISLIGFIDHLYGSNIDDHKFIGPNSPRYYTTSKLKKATAMNLYAYAMYENGYIKEDTCWLRYNLFVKDTARPLIKEVHVERTKEEIYAFYKDHIETMYRPMALAAKNCTEWHQVDSAMKQGKAKQACEKYGGCPYLDICLGKVSVDAYKERFNTASLEDKQKGQKDILSKLLDTNPTKNTPKGEKETKMAQGLLQQLKKSPASPATTQAPVAVEAPVAAPASEPTPVEAKAPAQAPAPWAFEACPKCKSSEHPGIFNNQPCNICVISTSEEIGHPVLDDYEVNVSDAGLVTWTEKDTQEAVVETKPVEQEPVVSETVDSKGGAEFEQEPEPVASEPVKEPAPKQDPIPPAAEGPAPTSHPLEDLDPKDFEQERMGFILSFNRVQWRGRMSKKIGEGNCQVYPSEIMEHIQGGLLKAANLAGAQAREWLDIDYFKRRDIIIRNAKEIAEVIGNSVIDASDVIPASDDDVLVSAVARYAKVVIGEKK